MKFVHSLWTKPLIGDQDKIDQNILCYKASSFLLKKYFPEIKLELVTDTLGSEILDKKYYDEIKLYFNDSIINDINPVFNTIPKLFALLKYDEDIIHFDGDFFLNSRNCIDDFDFDVIVQNKEAGRLFDIVYSQVDLVYSILLEKIPIENYAYNCGVLGFKNINFKNFYLKKAISLFYKIQDKFDLIRESLNYAQILKKPYNQKQFHEDLEIAPAHKYLCCFIEQYLLAVTASEKNIYVKEVMKLQDALKYQQVSFSNKKFIHPCGAAKNNASFLKCLTSFLEDLKDNPNIEICNFFEKNIEFRNEYIKSQKHPSKEFEESINLNIINWLKT